MVDEAEHRTRYPLSELAALLGGIDSEDDETSAPSTGFTEQESTDDKFRSFIDRFNFSVIGDGITDGMSVEELLEQYRNSQNFSEEIPLPLGMPPEEQTLFNILYGTAIAVALAGNLSVILVFLFGRRWKSDLSVFLVNLAFSDVVLAVFCMPFTMSQVVKHYWQFPDVLCPIVLFLQLSSVLTSVYTLVAIGVDRYLFVTKPLTARLTKRKGKLIVIAIWLFSLSLSSVQVGIRTSDE